MAAPLPRAPETLLLERRGLALVVTMNRPERRNALSLEMWREIDGVFASVRDDGTVRAVVLRGAGGNFSAGGDLKERDRTGGDADMRAALEARNALGGEILLSIDRAPQVVVAVVQGNALGGGLGLACVADVVLADASARFRLPELTLGIPPAQIAPYVVRRVGPVQAGRLSLTAATVHGAEALRLGLVDILCDAEDLDERLAAVIDGIARCAPGAIGATKALLRRASAGADDAYIAHAARIFAEAYLGPEGQEGAAAMRERRPPSWREPRQDVAPEAAR